MKEENFIRRWQIDPKVCDDIIDYFHHNEERHIDGGHVNGKGEWSQDKTRKESRDLGCFMHEVISIPCFDRYEKHLVKCTNEYIEDFPDLLNTCQFGLSEGFNIQHYKKGGGYKIEHFERSNRLDSSLKRALVFMTYLNDVPDGGTGFKYYDHIETAVKGKTIIWPVDWPHTHVGQITKKHEKYILTGWLTFNW